MFWTESFALYELNFMKIKEIVSAYKCSSENKPNIGKNFNVDRAVE